MNYCTTGILSIEAAVVFGILPVYLQDIRFSLKYKSIKVSLSIHAVLTFVMIYNFKINSLPFVNN